MHIHILGICGTFMGGTALLAQAAGHQVTGSDAGTYPPMSTLLAKEGIHCQEGFDPQHLAAGPDLVLIGNALSRGNPAVEHVLNQGLPYTSGPQWLFEEILQGRWVLGVAGTHGKTTTAAMLAWILECAGLHPGFLIGGVPANWGTSARLGEGPFFVVEADEYDTAFFDKRSKFVHCRPQTLVLNNLEYDHADIFADLAAIQQQFHYLLRNVPGTGRVLLPTADAALEKVLQMGCWSDVQRFAPPWMAAAKASWRAELLAPDGSAFRVLPPSGEGAPAEIKWQLCGQHNVSNALAAIAAARHTGVGTDLAAEALGRFQGVRRRLEQLAEIDGIRVYDDFAHHPTAIRLTLEGLRARAGKERILAVLELGSNSMRRGVHREMLAPAVAAADRVLWLRPPSLDWDLEHLATGHEQASIYERTADIINALTADTVTGDHVVIMSNRSFEGLHGRFLKALRERGAK